MSTTHWPFSPEALDDRFEPILTRVFDEATGAFGIKSQVSVNPVSSQDKEAIAIFAVDYRVVNQNKIIAKERSARSTGSVRWDSLLEGSRDAVACLEGEKAVVFDSRFLSLLLLLGHNTLLSFSQSMGGLFAEEELNGPERRQRMQNAHAHNIADKYLRYGNLSIYWNQKDRWYEDESLHDTGALIGRLPETPLPDSEEDLEIPAEPYITLLQTYLLPVALHEVSHLVDGEPGTSRAGQERQADADAVSAIRQRVESFGGEKLFHRQAVLEFAETMRDIVLADTFSGFRGLDARDALLYLEEKHPMPERLQDVPFLNPGRLAYGHFNPLPILTESELEDLIGGLEKASYASQHQHLLLRARAFAEAIDADEMTGGRDVLHGYDLFLRPDSEVGEGDWKALETGSNSVPSVPAQATGLSKDDLLDGIEDAFDLRSGIPAGDHPTWIGYRDRSFIEIAGPEDSLRKVRYVRHVNQTDGEDLQREDIHEIAIIIVLLRNVNPGWLQNQRVTEKVHEKAWSNPTPVIHEQVDDYIVSFGRLNNSALLQMKVQPAESFRSRRPYVEESNISSEVETENSQTFAARALSRFWSLTENILP